MPSSITKQDQDEMIRRLNAAGNEFSATSYSLRHLRAIFEVIADSVDTGSRAWNMTDIGMRLCDQSIDEVDKLRNDYLAYAASCAE